MRTTLVICLAVLTAAAAFAPVEGQPPGKSKSPTPGSKATTTPPAAGATPNMVAGNFPTEVGGKSIDGWIKEMENPDPSVRDHAIKMVIYFGPNARKAIPSLTKQSRMLEDLSPQASAILVMGELVPYLNADADRTYIQNIAKALTDALENPQAIIKYRAAIALSRVGPTARAAVPKLTQLVDVRITFEIRQAACLALGQVGRDEGGFPIMQALGALVKATRDTSKEVRIEALQAIVNLGPPLSADVSNFKNLLKQRLNADKDKSVQIWARVALMRIDATEVNEPNITTIAKSIKEGTDPEIHGQAAKALGFIGPSAKSAIPDLIDALKSDELILVADAMWALSRMGDVAERALPSLETLANSHPNDEIKAGAKATIDEIKKKK
jgi:HEAT repeat protein